MKHGAALDRLTRINGAVAARPIVRTHRVVPRSHAARRAVEHFGLGWLVLAAVAAWFLWSEHRTRLHGALPYAPESTGGATP